MQLALDPDTGRQLIHSVTQTADGLVVRIGETRHAEALIISEAGIQPWSARRLATLTEADLAPLLALPIELCLLGSGLEQAFPPPTALAEFAGRGIGLESMTTAAACRTYNLAVADGRRVAAALLLRPPGG